MKKSFSFGPWAVEYITEDGARLNRMSFNEYNLFTTEPITFSPPADDYGIYETRPVYGYDDCFPSVDSCLYPQKDWRIPDHGEICWLKWNVIEKENGLAFTVNSGALPLIFQRVMIFGKDEINWNFEVRNMGEKVLPFQHVMHPLMRLEDFTDFELPEFEKVHDEINHTDIKLTNSQELKKYLLNQGIGTATMLFIQKIKEGEMSWTYKNGIKLRVTFPQKYFPTIGIWWNNFGYPDEDGCRRTECAFEPIPGLNSVLSDNYKSKMCLSVPPGERFSWQIKWKVF